MKRGDIWTVAGGPDYTGKPRPVVIVQSQAFEGINSVTICPLTTDPLAAPLFRIEVDATPTTGLRVSSKIMIDKVSTVSRSKLGSRIGYLSDTDMLQINRSLILFLGLAGS
jgi:mRNA interferase MazF